MTVTDFSHLSPEKKDSLLIFKGDLPLSSGNADLTFKLYFYEKFYFEEVLSKSTHLILETNAVRKFDEFKKYLSAIRSENRSN